MSRAGLAIAAVLTICGCDGESNTLGTLPGVSITVSPAQFSLRIGQTVELQATVSDLAGRPLTDRAVQWASSAPEIVSVSETGVVTALDVGTAAIGAYVDQGVGFAQVTVPMGFRLPLSRAFVVAEMGINTGACAGGEGGVRIGGWECSHNGISRFSLDLADPDQWTGSPNAGSESDVLIAADGIIASVCLQPPTITCGPEGPYVVVEHRGGFMSIYGHLDPASVTLRRKTPVIRGQPLGKMGFSRADPAPWVHFELRHNNQGANAASVLGSVDLSGRTFQDFKVGETFGP